MMSNTCYAQVPRYLEYPKIIEQLKEWNTNNPNLTQLARAGYSDNNQPIYCLRISNFKSEQPKKKVLIIATIHGNESLAACMCLGYMGYILYHKDEADINEVLNNRDLYFMPACSPDSYMTHVRHVKGRDPNRDFNSDNPVAPVAVIKNLFQEIKPNAAISIHTFMRGYLIPHGNKRDLCANHNDFQSVVGEMARLSNYKLIRACQLYGHPIYGTELDYFYDNGAFAVVAEVGTNQKKSNWNEIEVEFKKTWYAFLYFLQKAPLIEIK